MPTQLPTGYVTWVSAAFGPFWGFQTGWWSWVSKPLALEFVDFDATHMSPTQVSGVADNSVYPVLFLGYITKQVPLLAAGPARWAFTIISVIGSSRPLTLSPALIIVLILPGLTFLILPGLTFLSYRGVAIVGNVAVGLCIFSLLPFVFLFMISIPQIEPGNLFEVDLDRVDWTVYLNVLFWNLNYWDSVATLVGEVKNPQETLPVALRYALLLVILAYLLPLVAAIGVSEASTAGLG